ncbi:MAG: hypothetical protein AAGC71_12500 [Pseudomonadota bacterium]
MTAIGSILLTLVAAGAMHISVRYAVGRRRLAWFGGSLIALALAFSLGTVFGGVWPGIYTVIAIFFLATMVSPWLDLWLSERRGR